LPINVKELTRWLLGNSILDETDEITNITVVEPKGIVKVTGNSEKDKHDVTHPISFTATFEELRNPIKLSKKVEREATVIEDDELEDDEVEEDKDKEDDEIRNPEQKGTKQDEQTKDT